MSDNKLTCGNQGDHRKFREVQKKGNKRPKWVEKQAWQTSVANSHEIV